MPDLLHELLEVVVRKQLRQECLVRLIKVIDKAMLDIQRLRIPDGCGAVDERIQARIIGKCQIKVPRGSGGKLAVHILIQVKAGAASVKILRKLLGNVHPRNGIDVDIIRIMLPLGVIAGGGIKRVLELLVVVPDELYLCL